MKARKSLVAGNWKMNGDVASNERLFAQLRAAIAPATLGRVDVVVCPPFPYLGQAAARLAGSAIVHGAQNVAEYPNGAYTGEVSSTMLADLGCRWAIVGHSERRTLFGERDEVVARKARAVLDGGVGVIACVGETLEEREAGLTTEVLARQIDALGPVATGLSRRQIGGLFVVAYEPVWAIGTGRTASPETAQEAHAFIRARLERHCAGAGDAIRILYGGSVKASNASSLFAMPDIDGGLIGGASLVADEFVAICGSAAAI